MTKEIAKKETTAIAKPMENHAWGAEGADAADVLIPKLLLMQGQSEFVSEGKAKAGDIVRSTTGEILGGTAKGVEIIPFLTFKTWILSENTGSKFEYRGVAAYTADNCNDPLEWKDSGRVWRRDRCLNFYVLLPADVQREIDALNNLNKTGEFPDPKDALVPCVLSFRRTSYGAGRVLSDHFVRAASFGRPPCVSKFTLNSKIEKNDQGTYYINTVEAAGMSTETQIQTCKKWYDIISANKNSVKVDESEFKEKKASPQKASPTPKRSSMDEPLDVDNIF